MALRLDEAEERGQPDAEWKRRAIAVLVNVLLDPYDSRSRDRVSHDDSPEIFITDPYEGIDNQGEGIPPEHLMSLDQVMRWIPASNPYQANKEGMEQFTGKQFVSQTSDLDRTATWEWAALREVEFECQLSLRSLR